MKQYLAKIQVADLKTTTFDDIEWAVERISDVKLEIPNTGVSIFTAPNGSGKSLIFKMIKARFDNVQSDVFDRCKKFKPKYNEKPDKCVLLDTTTIEADAIKSAGQKKYEAIMEAVHTPNSLILLDGPESSLHICLQESLIDKILPIIENNGSQVIITTHSPNIINGHFAMLMSKKFTSKEKKEV